MSGVRVPPRPPHRRLPRAPARRFRGGYRAAMSPARPLTIAVTGPTGTFGYGLMPLLQADPKVGRIVGVARRPFDPSTEGWTKLEYRQGDVRDLATLETAFAGADVVVHLAFIITGSAGPEATR